MDLFEFLYKLGEKYGLSKLDILEMIRFLKWNHPVAQYDVLLRLFKEHGIELEYLDKVRLMQFFSHIDVQSWREKRGGYRYRKSY